MGSGSGASCNLTFNTTLSDNDRLLYQNPDIIQQIIHNSKNIAIVGLSSEAQKASNMVASYLQDEGYRIIPVNPKSDYILGEKCYPDLISIPEQIDVVDIFRPSSEIVSIVDQAIQCKAKFIWMQLKIINYSGAEKAVSNGIKVVMDKCIKMEHGRYGGGLHTAGMNTEIISARRKSR